MRAYRPHQQLSQDEYTNTINEGLKLLEVYKVHSGKIITFDLANPFNFLTGGQPSEGDYSWFHAGRNISRKAYIPPKYLFQDVNYIMIPVFPMQYDTKKILLELYGKYIDENYLILGENRYWRLYGISKLDIQKRTRTEKNVR